MHPLRTYRQRNNLTLAELALRAKTTEGTISRIERGTLRPTFELLRRLVAATDGEVTADDIIASTPASDPV